MAKESPVGELGTRYKCFKCETKFYDLGRPQPICPSCGEDQNNRETRQILKRKKKRSSLKMEPDIPILPEEHDVLMDHEDHDGREGHDHEDHEHEGDLDEEKGMDHDDYSADKPDREAEEGYGPE
jgi:uncharacterized protein (TIGR02300 family)